MNEDKELWTIEETAAYYRISARTIYNRVRPGSTLKPFPIKPVRIGRLLRFRSADCKAYRG